jgi:predicted ATPase/serine phosphatase RsbU (regulator of sigma subunit)/tRNA A-37 threonylcarbamoyl transferase component Bud32
MLLSLGHADKILFDGANSTLYYYEDSEFDKPIIVKVLKEDYPSSLQIVQFNNEFEFVKGLEAEGVRKIYKKAKIENKHALVLEYFEGVTLRKAFSDKQWNIRDFLNVAIAISHTLTQIHAQYIIHKDINSNNILVNAEKNEIKIIDFGISSRIDARIDHQGNPETLEGTLAYISPEQTGRMNRMVDQRSDLYSLGITFFEILTGDLPFAGDDPIELVHSHLAQKPALVHKKNASVPPVISEIIAKLLEKNAEDRYQSAFGLETDLKKCLNQLNKKLVIEPFKLAQDDFSGKFKISQKLYGREQEVRKLLEAFDRVSRGAVEMVLIAGYSGVGKTSLVSEIQKPVTQKKGYFIRGKFDQYQRNIPYSAIIQSLNELVNFLLTEDKSDLLKWKGKIEEAIGKNGQVLIDVIPNLEFIIGKQPPVDELQPTEARNRFNYVFRNFIRTITRREHPIVLFIDDLQWADTASLKLLQLLMNDSGNHYLLIVGAYRENEINASHPLIKTIDDIQEKSKYLANIQLGNLNYENVRDLIRATLKQNDPYLNPLIELIFKKTLGNPFFLTQFFRALYEEELLSFDFETKKWIWELSQIQQKNISDDVVELLAVKVSKLPALSQEALQLASCIGDTFSFNLLALLFGRNQEETFEHLWIAIEEGLVIPLDDNYRFLKGLSQELSHQIDSQFKFLHDNVQQAIYSLIPDRQRGQTHLAIGRWMQQNLTNVEQEQRIFDIVNQLNSGSEFITVRKEVLELAALNLKTGKRAKMAAAYDSAYNYLQKGVSLVGQLGWVEDYRNTIILHVEAAKSAYLSGNSEQMSHLVDIILKNATSLLDKVRAYEVVIYYHIAKSDMLGAINKALEVLAMLNVSFPKKPNKLHVYNSYLRTQVALKGRKPIDLAKRPELKDEKVMAITRILSTISLASFLSLPELYPLLIFKQVRLLAKHGNAPVSAFVYSSYGIILCGVIGKIELGYEFGKLAHKMIEKYKAEKFAARTQMVWNGLIRHWKDPIKETLPLLVGAYRRGMDTGSFEYGSFSAFVYCINLFASGATLDKLNKETAYYRKSVKQLNQEGPFILISIFRQITLNLQGDAKNPLLLKGKALDELTLVPKLEKANDNSALGAVYICKSILAHTVGDLEKLNENLEMCRKHLQGLRSTVGIPLFYFYEAMLHCALIDKSEKNKSTSLKKLQSIRKLFQNWAKHAPDNYQHKLLILDAEIAKVNNKHALAENFYQRAISLAQKNGFIPDEAIASELYAKYWLNVRKQKDIASLFFRNAFYAYKLWGASIKLKQLNRDYKELLKNERKTKSTNSEPLQNTTSMQNSSVISTSMQSQNGMFLDVSTLMKASQALAQEVQLESLLPKMIKIVLENAGAERGILVQRQAKGMYIMATSSTEAGKDEGLVSVPLEKSQDLSVRLVNYVIRTQKPLVIGDASNDKKYVSDPYIELKQPKSVLCFPIVRKKEVLCVLYLENNLTTDAFTTDRVRLLTTLSAQIAISLENSLFYQELEAKVQGRTQELQGANKELAEQSKRITDSIRYAETIQKAILPNHLELKDVFDDYFVIFKPKDIVSGDFYWFSNVGKYTFLAVVDCTGHGVPGAFMSMIAHAQLNEIVNEKKVLDPNLILYDLHEGIRVSLHQRESDNTDGMDLCLCRFEKTDKGMKVVFAGAKRPLYRSDKDGVIKRIKGSNAGIGGGQRKKYRFYENILLELHKGESIYLTTDGFVDQVGASSRRTYGSRRFIKTLETVQKMNATDQKQTLLNELSRHKREEEQRDDITIIGVRV